MATMIGRETRANTDNLHYFDKQSAVRPAPPQWRLPRFQASILPYFEQPQDGLRAAVRKEQGMAQLVSRYGFFQDKRALLMAYCARPDNGNVQYWMAREFSNRLPDRKTICRKVFRK